MAQQIINVGAAANDGTGDNLRVSQQKANENFTELYNNAVFKSYYGTYTDSTTTGTAVALPLPNAGQKYIHLTNSGLVSLSGVDLSGLAGDETDPFDGKVFVLFNDTGNDITLLHEEGTDDKDFIIRKGVDLLFPNGEFLEIKFGGGGMAEGLKSWSEAQKLIFIFTEPKFLANPSTAGNWSKKVTLGGTFSITNTFAVTNHTLLGPQCNFLSQIFKAPKNCVLKKIIIQSANTANDSEISIWKTDPSFVSPVELNYSQLHTSGIMYEITPAQIDINEGDYIHLFTTKLLTTSQWSTSLQLIFEEI